MNFYYEHAEDFKALSDAATDEIFITMDKMLALATKEIAPGSPDFYPGAELIDIPQLKADHATMDLAREEFIADVQKNGIDGVIANRGL